MSAPIESRVTTREPAEAYHARSREFLSSHALRDFRKCPLLFRKKQLGQLSDGDHTAYLIGRAAHTLILEGAKVFEAEYAVGGPINPKTERPFGAETKAFAEWAARVGRPVLTQEQYDLVLRMAQSVTSHFVAADLLSAGEPEGVVRTDYCSVPCQIRMDWFDPHEGIIDLKTCDDLTWFEADARRFGYIHQLAFYRAVLAQVIGLPMPIRVIAVEKREPHRTGVWRIDELPLTQAQTQNEAAIERLKICVATDHWPTGYEEVRELDSLYAA